MLDIVEPLEPLEPRESPLPVPPQARKRPRHVREFASTVTDDARMTPNHAERRRCGEAVSTAFVEPTVNRVMAKRRCPGSSRGRGPPGGAHLLGAAAHPHPRRDAR